ncbi:hypothetical protein AADZ86_04275 [Colwelliaceae bacterium BS250]
MLPLLSKALVASSFALILSTSFAQSARIPNGGKIIAYTDELLAIKLSQKTMTAEKLLLGNDKYSQVLQVSTLEQVNNPWNAQISLNLKSQGIKKTDTLLLKITARQTYSEIDDGSFGQVDVFINLIKHTGKPTNHTRLAIPKKWTTFYIPFYADNNAIENEAKISLLMGGLPKQVLEFSELELIDYNRKLPASDLPATETVPLEKQPETKSAESKEQA